MHESSLQKLKKRIFFIYRNGMFFTILLVIFFLNSFEFRKNVLIWSLVVSRCPLDFCGGEQWSVSCNLAAASRRLGRNQRFVPRVEWPGGGSPGHSHVNNYRRGSNYKAPRPADTYSSHVRAARDSFLGARTVLAAPDYGWDRFIRINVMFRIVQICYNSCFVCIAATFDGNRLSIGSP